MPSRGRRGRGGGGGAPAYCGGGRGGAALYPVSRARPFQPRGGLPIRPAEVPAPSALTAAGLDKWVEGMVVPDVGAEEVEKVLSFPGRAGIRANQFPEIWHYDVDIKPDVTTEATRRVIIRELVRLYGQTHLGNGCPAYDGRKRLYTVGWLPFESNRFIVKLPEKNGNNSKRVEKDFTVTIKYAGRPDLRHLEQFMRVHQIDSPQETIQALDMVLREKPSTESDIGDGMECQRGYYQSLHPTQMGLSPNIDIMAPSFYKSVPVIEFVAEGLCINVDNIKKAMKGIRVEVNHMKGIRVEVNHMLGLTRQYKIKELTPLSLAQLMFEDESGAKVHVANYCNQAVGDSGPTYLPMEVGIIVEGQIYSKKPSDKQVIGILRAICKLLPERKRSIHEMALKYDSDHEEVCKPIGPELALVEGRVLTQPRLKYNEIGREKSCNLSVGCWSTTGKGMVNDETVQNWEYISYTKIPIYAVHRFLHDLVNICSRSEMLKWAGVLVVLRMLPISYCKEDNSPASPPAPADVGFFHDWERATMTLVFAFVLTCLMFGDINVYSIYMWCKKFLTRPPVRVGQQPPPTAGGRQQPPKEDRIVVVLRD